MSHIALTGGIAKFGMGRWRKGGTQPHMASFDSLTSVAEFAASGKALHDETYQYV